MVEHETHGILVPVGDVDRLSAAFVRLAQDVALRQRMGEAARDRAEAEFSVAAHVDRMERVLATAAGR